MKLSNALRINNSQKVAFVGAGGKTSAIFILGQQLLENISAPPSVMISTTTHMGLFQAVNADRHIILKNKQDLLSFHDNFPRGLIMVSGEPDGDEKYRVAGIPQKDMLDLADRHHIPLLIEADGARMLPLKAPADHEPVIPYFVDTVVVLAGLSALGKPLSAEWVHRPERFAQLSGLAVGDIITPQALQQVLMHPQGGLKNIPPHSRRVVLFNQADSEELQSIAQKMADTLLDKYQAIIVGSFSQSIEDEEHRESQDIFLSKIPDKANKAEEIFAVHERIAGVVLAGGEARRYGQPKQLLVWRGQPLVRRAVATALDAGLAPVIVVTGAIDMPIREALQGLPVQFIHNPKWQEGLSTSVKTGVSALPDYIGGAVFLLADQPRITPSLVRALVEMHATSLLPLTAPQVAGQRATPVLFDRGVFEELKRLTGDQGGRALFSRYPAAWVPWHDIGLTMDIDTPENFQQLLNDESN